MSTPPHAEWIGDPQRLAERAADFPPGQPIGLDTEFIRERTFYPQLALVQIAAGGRILLVDPLVEGMPAALRPLLEDATIPKLMHSASEDLQALRRGCAAVPDPLFDTQVAAALCGLGAGLGYQKLVQQLTGTALEKGETRSDWLRRPLSESQLRYAAEDVVHLHELHAALDSRLGQLGRGDWLRAECERALRDDADDPWPHLALRGAQGLGIEAQVRLCRLLRWRDAYARRQDRPRSWILENELAVLLAQRAPDSVEALESLFSRHPKAPRKLATQVLAALQTPVPGEAGMPEASPPQAADRQRIKRLQQEVAAIAAELELPEGLLCSRRHLERWLLDGQWPQALSGWRQPLLQARLQAIA
jgi:ribonuclease D